jgi:hypothetical protein
MSHAADGAEGCKLAVELQTSSYQVGAVDSVALLDGIAPLARRLPIAYDNKGLEA